MPDKAKQKPKQPNILVIFGDDIGQSNISAYTHGLVGYHTPNIDRVAKEGMMFTDYYAENSCTAGRSSFITGQSPDQYCDWVAKNVYLTGEATLRASIFLETFMEYPPSQRPASFSVDQVRKHVDKKIDESFAKRGLE